MKKKRKYNVVRYKETGNQKDSYRLTKEENQRLNEFLEKHEGKFVFRIKQPVATPDKYWVGEE